MMTPEIAWLLILLAAALVFFAFEWIPADVVAMGLLLALIVTRLVPPEKAFEGFSSDAVIMILGLLVQTAALIRTGSSTSRAASSCVTRERTASGSCLQS